MTALSNLLGMDRAALAAWFVDLGEKPYRAVQVLKWIHQRGVDDFSAMTDLGKALRQSLAEIACISAPEIRGEQQSTDGTRKWLLRVDARNSIEMVFIPEAGRGTLCVSSQVGCALNCSFCATARQGFSRNLTSAEIVGQLWLAKRILSAENDGVSPVTNVVMMGMGEPLLNFDQVVTAMRLMLEDCAYGLARRRVTLSTTGLVPAMDRLREACPVSLAVSLHAPDNDLRDRLVPVNRKYPIDKLMAACKRYIDGAPREKVTFEYVMLDGVNDSPQQARALVKRLQGLRAKINLIPFNPFSGAGYERSSDARIDAFRNVLTAAGLTTVTRKTRGGDIDAACGQLAGAVTPKGRIHVPPPVPAAHAVAR